MRPISWSNMGIHANYLTFQKKILFPIAILFDLIVTRLVMDRFENLEIIQNSRKKWKSKSMLLIHIHYLKELPWTENPNSVYRSITIKYIVISKFREQKKESFFLLIVWNFIKKFNLPITLMDSNMIKI